MRYKRNSIAAAAQTSLETGGIRKSDIFLYGLVLVMSRLAAPWQLIRIATRAAESDDTARIAETPYAAAVTLVLSEAESMVGELRAELRAGRPVVSILKAIHDAARGLRSEMDLSVEFALEPPAGGDPRRGFGFAESRDRGDAGLRPAACCGRAPPRKSRRARCSTPSTSTKPRCGSNLSALAGNMPTNSPSTK